jgi:hypothetical protein
MSDKNLEQRINIKFGAKTGKSDSETLAILTVAYGEEVMKKWSVFNDTEVSRKGKNIFKTTKEVSSKNAKDRCKYGQSTNLGAFRSKMRYQSNSRKIECE